MARTLYGGTGGDVISQLSSDGDFEPSTAVFEAYTTRTGATKITDLQTLAGAAISTITPDADGRVMVFGPDAYTGQMWLQDLAQPSKPRWAIHRSDLDTTAGAGGVTAHSALTGLAADDHTQYHNDARGDARYYTKAQVDTATQQATTTVRGTVEIGTAAELTTGTDPARVPSLDIVRAEIDNHNHVSTDITDIDFSSFMPAAFGIYVLEWNGTTYPNRSTATSDPNRVVMWVGGPGPTKSGTGSTGAVTGDMYVA